MYWIKYLKPYKYHAFFGFFFKLLEAILELCVPLVVAYIVDNGVKMHQEKIIYQGAFLLFILAVLGYASASICQYFASYASQGLGTLIRHDLFKNVNELDFKQLDEISSSSLITRITSDVNQLQLAVAMLIRLVSRSPFLIVGSILLSFTINIELGWIILGISPFIAGSIFFIMRYSEHIYKQIQKLLDYVSRLTHENLGGMRVIRAFNRQNIQIKKFEDTINTQKYTQLFAGYISGLLNPFTTIIINFGIILVLYVSGIKVNIGTLSQGDVIALMNYMNQILLSMYVFANVILIFIKANTSYKRIVEILEMKPHFKEGLDTSYNQNHPFLSFENVSYSYGKNIALDNINFTLNKGESIGIIGGTGSGKSTLSYLIPRFYDINHGQIKIYGKDIKDYTFDTLRNLISLNMQSSVLFQGDIQSNLRWGKKDASMQEMKEALTISQAIEFVDKKEGLNTKIEEAGHNFSGGQRQRLAIARALMKPAELLILDDSSSALDYATDALLRKEIKKLNKTIMIISQRVSSIQDLDHILVLHHGRQVGFGTHEELLKTCPIYQEIVISQGGSYEN